MTGTILDVSLGQLVAQRPQRARVLEHFGLDYCCGGRVTLARACALRGLHLASVLAELDACDRQEADAGTGEWEPATLGELADSIVATHHAYLRRELPRLAELVEKVAHAHGHRHPELWEIRDALDLLARDLLAHLIKEEWVVFPLIKRLEAGLEPDQLGGSLAASIGSMEHEHDDAGRALGRLRELSRGFAAPPEACPSYRTLMAGLADLEADTHRHVHKENSLLFPRALDAEARAWPTGAATI